LHLRFNVHFLRKRAFFVKNNTHTKPPKIVVAKGSKKQKMRASRVCFPSLSSFRSATRMRLLADGVRRRVVGAAHDQRHQELPQRGVLRRIAGRFAATAVGEQSINLARQRPPPRPQDSSLLSTSAASSSPPTSIMLASLS
jgi:hypothetical protein